MVCRFVVRSVFSALALGIVSSASAGVLWNESVNTDLSGNGLAPTFIGTLAHGSNQVFGSTGSTAGVPDRDYFFITVPVGLHLALISVLPGTTSGNLSFMGLQEGSQVTLPTNTQTADGLLGWWHYSPADVGTDILLKMSDLAKDPVAGRDADGFTIPLGAGNYAFWVQDTSGGGPFNYGFDLFAVPEPGTIAIMLLGLGGLGFSRRKRA